MHLLRPLLALILPASAALHAQSFYGVTKNQNFVQRSATGAVPDPLRPFTFEAQAANSATLTLPSGATQPLALGATDNGRYGFAQVFTSAVALHAAFPTGTYRMTGTGIPTLTFNLNSDVFPSATPQVVSVSNGTWSSTGMLVIDPAQPCILNFSTFTTYGTAGLGSHMGVDVWSLTGDDPRLAGRNFASVPVADSTLSTTPFTSYTIPANALRSGHAYAVELDFDTAFSLDTTSVPAGFAVTLATNRLVFYVAAQSPGTSTPPPVIVAQPANVTTSAGGRATFSVAVTVGGSGQTGNLNYDWRLNGQQVRYSDNPGGKYTGSNATNLVINNVTAADAGSYSVVITNAGGIVTSTAATLTLGGGGPGAAPQIVTQPRGATVNAGTTVALTVAATGSPAVAYQWQKDGAAVPGATSDTLVLANIAAAQAGNYQVVVTNSAGSAQSAVAAVNVVVNQPSRLPNLSVRTNLGASQTLIVGFATNGAKDMLVRGVGPALGVFGLSGFLADPVIELYDSSSRKVDENDNWGGTARLAGTFTDVGAFALPPASKDAALLRTCTGPYTAQIKGAGSGVVLVEVYEAGGSGKLANVSARNFVGTGDNILITGFVVDGTAAKTLLIRGVGARLAEFGVPSVLADPKLEIYSGSVKIAENDNWNSLLQPVAQSVGAFDLTPGSRDAALVITLSPGAYTAQISGVGGTTGEALVEVYEVP